MLINCIISVTIANEPFALDVGAMIALRSLCLHTAIWSAESQSDTYSLAVCATLPRTSLHTVTSTISQSLSLSTCNGSSSSSSGTSNQQLETLSRLFSKWGFKQLPVSELGNVGWQRFVRVVEELAMERTLVAHLERGTTKSDSRSGASSVTVVVSIWDIVCNYPWQLLEEKFGVGLMIADKP